MATKGMTADKSETQEVPVNETPIEQTIQEPEPSQNENAESTPEIYPAYTFGPDNGGDIVLDAWRGLYHVFDARAERFDVTPDGVFAVNVTMAPGFNPKDVVADMGGGKRHPRLDFVSSYLAVTGQEPKPFEGESASVELTRWLTTNFRSEENGGRSPQYAKDRIAALKKSEGLEKPRGRRPRKLLEQISAISPDILAGLDPDALAKLREVIAKAEHIQEATPVTPVS